MAETARRMSAGLGADAARRLIVRPIRRQTTQTARQTEPSRAELVANAPFPGSEPVLNSDLTRRLEADILVMKAVLAAERQENQMLRRCIDVEDDDVSDEARAIRERWSGLVDRLLQASR